MMGRFNSFLKSTILRINEARDLGEVDRFKFYDHLKVYAAAPPDVLRVDEKHLREHYIFNCVGVIISTNYRTDGIYLSEQDRRHFVAWSELRKTDFETGYFDRLWAWLDDGGAEQVAAYLRLARSAKTDAAKRPKPGTDRQYRPRAGSPMRSVSCAIRSAPRGDLIVAPAQHVNRMTALSPSPSIASSTPLGFYGLLPDRNPARAAEGLLWSRENRVFVLRKDQITGKRIDIFKPSA
jgi:hypothetical protein